jgi:hypothetical protein
MPMDQDVIVVGVVPGRLEAEILRGMLEAAGIPVSLSHESAGTVYGFGVGPMAEVEILVPRAHAGEARRLLDAYRADRLDVGRGDQAETD